MQLKAILTAAAATLAMSGTAAQAGNYTGNVALATDYIFRGVSQTQERPAIQAASTPPSTTASMPACGRRT